MTAAIEVRDLIKRYRKGKVNAVDRVSFDVEPGQFFALLGPNGAGKTTTISILTTTLSPTSGSVRIAGHEIVREASLVRRQVGIIFQSPSLDMNLTGEENVRFHAILYGLYPCHVGIATRRCTATGSGGSRRQGRSWARRERARQGDASTHG